MWRVDGVERFVVVAGVIAAIVIALPTRAGLAKAGHRFAREYDLWIAPELMIAVDRAHRRDRWVLATAVLAAVLLFVLLPPATFRPFIVVAAVLPVFAVGRLLLGGRDFPVRAGRATVARSRAVGVTDYLRPTVPLAFALWVAVGGVAAVLGALWSEPAVLAGGVLLVVATLVVAAYVVALCRRPEPASGAEHLYLQDAWRVSRLDLTLSQLGFAAVYLGLVAAGDAPSGRVAVWVGVAGVATAAYALGVGGRGRFRERLWPELPPGRLLAVGGPA